MMLSTANEILSAGQTAPAAAAAPAFPADMCMVGMLRAVKPVTRKDGSVVEGFFRFAVETSVSYTTGKDVDGEYVWHRVNHKTIWFNADQELADELNGYLESNEWTLVRNWYRFTTSAKNVIDVQQRDYATNEVRRDDEGKALMCKALNPRSRPQIC